ncbi:beta-1,4-galactosyltransferase galt-1-like [Sceloporus undulatus]|uniref:beta-1,4-galactosyltransferase galt-1-like n=1 Tax=Sceloporus undulatus TaxID=8520 RepID=UPI001C4CF3F1|nr:beta-1,4-galactosyltransferase galt-1-like [Sceloporus undulatus]
MICFRRKTYLATGLCLVAFASMLTVSYHRIQKYSQLPKIVGEKGKQLCRREVTNNSISVLKDTNALVIAPYFDNREEKLTRIIAIVHHEKVKEHYCWFCCLAKDEVYISKVVINIHSDRFGFPFAVADMVCVEPANCEPRYVALHPFPKGDINLLPWFEIKNRKFETSPVEFTVCISTMFGDYNNVLQFIQSMEMYKLLGMQKVVVYKNSCSQLMERVLDFYVAEGTLEIVPWPITSYLNVSTQWRSRDDGTQIGYYGQIAALNDCVYRNMYRSRYVLLNDVDEIILPINHTNWKTMMESLEEQNPEDGVFLFESYVFPNTVFTSNSASIPSWNMVPGVNILHHVLREPDRKEVFNPRKMIVNPRKVIQTSVHSVLQAFGDSVKVPMDVAMVYHCRTPLQRSLSRKYLIRDTTLWRYNSSLISKVNQVLQNIPLSLEKR